MPVSFFTHLELDFYDFHLFLKSQNICIQLNKTLPDQVYVTSRTESKFFKSFVFLLLFSSCSSNSIDPTGTYKLVSDIEIRNGDTYGRFGEIGVKKLKDDKIVLSLNVCRGAPSYNVGLVDDTLKIENNHLVLKCNMPEIDQKGELHFYFSKRGINVRRNI